MPTSTRAVSGPTLAKTPAAAPRATLPQLEAKANALKGWEGQFKIASDGKLKLGRGGWKTGSVKMEGSADSWNNLGPKQLKAETRAMEKAGLSVVRFRNDKTDSYLVVGQRLDKQGSVAGLTVASFSGEGVKQGELGLDGVRL